MRLLARNDLAGPLHLERDPEFERQHVHGAGRDDPQSGLPHSGTDLVPGAGHAVGDLVDGPVAADGDDDVGIRRVTFRETDGFLGPARSVEFTLDAALGQTLLHRVGDGACPAPT